MNKTEKIEPYQAYVSEEIISKWSGIVRVWSEPKSAVEEATVVDEIKEPIQIAEVKELQDTDGHKAQRAKIKCGKGREGWVLSDTLAVRK